MSMNALAGNFIGGQSTASAFCPLFLNPGRSLDRAS